MVATNVLNAVLVCVLALNLFTLGTGQIRTVIQTAAIQGALLGLLPFLIHEHYSVTVVLLVTATVSLKGIVIPLTMLRALREARIRREVEPLIGLQFSIVLGAGATSFALLFANRLPLAPTHQATLIVPTAIATIMTGFILLTTRYKALGQVVGYLVLENGIYLFGMLLLEALPFVVEMGVLLDLFVGIFVIGIVLNNINQAFSSMDTRQLASLKE